MPPRRKERPPRDPLRWRITEQSGRLAIVQSEQACPLLPGESIVWEGQARHMTEAYRLARDSGLPIYMTREGFKLRRQTRGANTNRG